MSSRVKGRLADVALTVDGGAASGTRKCAKRAHGERDRAVGGEGGS